ncbi:2-succinyl-5-enolpyruvyl-6-hydroxy-3-cyclohexene-1-carboxylic-acid synthase [Myroides odoratimimus]|uniref:2-succinyl-5-enolpyruvyl-6-hydroxy-3- cyclohexene-1-carboxylic-acid synthase n=1 Tax=Myroides odoratimimus TaxID=76832 RepID=UPI00103DD7BB|nr:2-succinyl-5-enolpyruvyl-6-hydroxy-3-cyclohexene-1-carboxylic-acid synthase [Myroides odoratimimus]MCS7474171.1 2-succinyl-5-enolpyruvyl-6-hydroxy-3-cyclohexene-1-carboxylic-acid synthase [Myroides odoratimimus]MDM1036336.1 2-succinyl-5-enolpyruvyl-6-hydroxy-3-cyclohexene-1-carboxylic-acid synthase [Myroides odoratimimus]MDM1039792.1 2-succinyl-5-enolpyruvyl-6-hydroxy-3-cyclohexene-1-carboxylic-acid synthase [Myroides odoratimimus]MDM1054043.1 2-succinyl-5-enolpyruvyl-6-hydroxy-3-cyclohexene
MNYPQIELAQSIIEICKAKNIQHIIISPGSRNAPLTIGFASDPFFTCYSLADERCAAFFGMGIAQQTAFPIALVCTSGSALLNYYPAVAEAFYSQIPMVIISADRPTSKIDIGDGQTIRQRNVYENHIVYNANLTEEASNENDILINNAINTAIAQKGPVHINAPFEEPLYNTVEELTVTPTIINLETLPLQFKEFDQYIDSYKEATKKLILVGVNTPDALSQEIINWLANDPSVIIMTETTSNLHHPHCVEHIDRIITTFSEEDFLAFQPDLLITFGGMVISKRIKVFLRKYKPTQHWHIDTLRHYDTYNALNKAVLDTPENFFQTIKENVEHYTTSNYYSWMQSIVTTRLAKHEAYLKTIPFSDLSVFETLFAKLPKGTQLQISNSSAIRYAQLIKIDASNPVYCNRGTSGIDGSTSTAIGAAVATQKPTLLITGDIGFLYDSNGLWNNYIPKDFKILLLNNGGGGIFRILPGHKETPVFNTYFETSHHHTAEHLAKMYNFKYQTATNKEELEQQCQLFFEDNNGPAILEVFTPTEVNNTVLSNYFRNM